MYIYKNTIGLAMKIEVYKCLYEQLEYETEKTQKQVNELLKRAKFIDNYKNYAILIVWENISWEFSDVARFFLEYFLRCMDKADFYFVRVGEFLKDIEVHGEYNSNPFHLRIETNVVYTYNLTY